MRVVWLGLLLPLAARVPPEGDDGLPSSEPTAEERAECEARGGRIGAGGLCPRACRFDHDDAGQVCRGPDDCEGACAATGTGGICALRGTPSGCVDLLDEGGCRGLVCID